MVFKHGLDNLGVWSSYFNFLRQLGHNLGLWVYVHNKIGMGLAKTGEKLKTFFNEGWLVFKYLETDQI